MRDESAKCSGHGTLLVLDAVMCSSYNDADMVLLYKKALCRYCDITFIAPKKCDLLRHKQTKMHEPNVAAAKKSSEVRSF